MTVDTGLVRGLKMILDEVAAAGRQHRPALVDRKARQARRLRAEDWLAALDRAVGRSVRRSGIGAAGAW